MSVIRDFYMEKEVLRIYKLSRDGVRSEVFLDGVDLQEYVYTAQRMGTSTVTATLEYPVCLDEVWTGREFVEFRDERYFLLHRPSSRKDNTDARYIHSLVFESERDITLNSVYFCDAVRGDAGTVDKYQSNNLEVSFFGTLDEFVARFNDVLEFRGLSDRFVVEIDDVWKDRTEARMCSFDNSTLFDALQHAYEVWEVPFCFYGDTAVFCDVTEDDVVDEVFEYGQENELLSVSVNNSNAKVVTRILGSGSGENLPYYYPNPTPKGWLGVGGTAGAVIVDPVKFARMPEDAVLTYGGSYKAYITTTRGQWNLTDVEVRAKNGSFLFRDVAEGKRMPVTLIMNMWIEGRNYQKNFGVTYTIDRMVLDRTPGDWSAAYSAFKFVPQDARVENYDAYGVSDTAYSLNILPNEKDTREVTDSYVRDSIELDYVDLSEGWWKVVINGYIQNDFPMATVYTKNPNKKYDVSYFREAYFNWEFRMEEEASGDFWGDQNGIRYNLDTIGLSVDSPVLGKTITQTVTRYIRPSAELMPPVYRESDGEIRGYEARNETYVNPETGEYWHFDNEYNPLAPREHVESEAFSDIKVSIDGLVNSHGENVNLIDAVYFETGYNTRDTDDNGNLRYQRFYVRLKPLTFNVFAHAVETDKASLSMTSGDCGGCRFDILVDEQGRNTIQTDGLDSEGKPRVKTYSNGRVVEGAPQQSQNDTTDNYVWVALALDQSTYGGKDVEFGIMPSYDETTGRGQKPKKDDSFVFIGVTMPEEYILAAEQRLKEAMIKFMAENNDEKYTVDIKMSRIFLAQNPDIAESISERSALKVRYAGRMLSDKLFVREYTYRCTNGEALPEISVTLGDVIEIPSSGIEDKIAASVEQKVSVIQGSTQSQTPDNEKDTHLRSDKEDVAKELITFRNGIKVAKEDKGGGASILLDNEGNSYMELDYLNVRKRMTVTEAVLDQIKSVGGRIVVSVANGTISRVEATEGLNYRCYLESLSDDGNIRQNPFSVGDLVICQSFNAQNQRYYWRRVLETGTDFIVLSNQTGQYGGSDYPQAGDSLVQLGNAADRSRQSAQILSCYGDNAPSFVMYTGIDSFSLAGKEIFGAIYEPTSRKDASGNTIYEPYFFNYGSMLLGDKTKTKDYIQYDNVTGAVTIKANVTLEAGSDISSIQEIKDMQAAVEGLDYIKENLKTVVSGGLVLTSTIKLGHPSGDSFVVMSGINGLYDTTKKGNGIAAWFGGAMVDKEEQPAATDFAKSLFRMDGTGYLASGNIKWDEEGGASFAGGKMTITKDGNISLGDGVVLGGSTGKTVSTILQNTDNVVHNDGGSNAVLKIVACSGSYPAVEESNTLYILI